MYATPSLHPVPCNVDKHARDDVPIARGSGKSPSIDGEHIDMLTVYATPTHLAVGQGCSWGTTWGTTVPSCICSHAADILMEGKRRLKDLLRDYYQLANQVARLKVDLAGKQREVWHQQQQAASLGEQQAEELEAAQAMLAEQTKELQRLQFYRARSSGLRQKLVDISAGLRAMVDSVQGLGQQHLLDQLQGVAALVDGAVGEVNSMSAEARSGRHRSPLM